MPYGYDEHTRMTAWDVLRFGLAEAPLWAAFALLMALDRMVDVARRAVQVVKG